MRVIAIAWAGLLIGPALAADLAPQTKLRLTIVQWMPLEADFKPWDALGGELVVSPEGTITMPVLGAISVLNMTPDAVADSIALALQSKMGLVSQPNVSVQIIEYAPVFVVGAVAKPGAYSFQPGLTVLQALAIGGGNVRSSEVDMTSTRLTTLATLKGINADLVRSRARIARLKAEYALAPEIVVPPELTAAVTAATPSAQEVLAQEQSIFDAQLNQIGRQSASYNELRQLIAAEIEVLQTKIANLDASIAASQTELDGVRTLVERGVVTVARRSDLEQKVASLRADRLDQMTAMMRARQNQSEAERNIDGLADQQRTQVAKDLQSEQTNLERLMLAQDTTQRLLREMDAGLALQGGDTEQGAPTLVFTIVRQLDGSQTQIEADESTVLMPNDVLKVAIKPGAEAGAGGSNG